MPTYYDASFLLAGFLEPDQPVHQTLWDDEPVKLGSSLLEAECVTVLRRVAATWPATEATEFLTTRLEWLDRCLVSILVESVNDEVLRRLRNEPRLGNCRTLDALHLATALLFQEQLDERLTVCTLDQRMRATAHSLGFVVAP
jgi:predicted nucleic acid-binding protein